MTPQGIRPGEQLTPQGIRPWRDNDSPWYLTSGYQTPNSPGRVMRLQVMFGQIFYLNLRGIRPQRVKLLFLLLLVFSHFWFFYFLFFLFLKSFFSFFFSLFNCNHSLVYLLILSFFDCFCYYPLGFLFSIGLIFPPLNFFQMFLFFCYVRLCIHTKRNKSLLICPKKETIDDFFIPKNIKKKS